MLRAIILDFNGIILNDEPLHFQAMRDCVSEIGISISEEEYWSRYLPLDDERCLQAICSTHARILTEDMRTRLLKQKITLYRRYLKNQYPLFPGAANFIRAAHARYPLALASGARRDEIESALTAVGLMECFEVIVAAQDFKLGKPHPESFLLALRWLNAKLNGKGAPIRPEDCLVIEDSMGGVEGARAAGMACLAVTNSYPAEKLWRANRVVASLEQVSLDDLCQRSEGDS
jgi:beta-phosphoglucomutase